jgi:Excalibur calcium-binding domain
MNSAYVRIAIVLLIGFAFTACTNPTITPQSNCQPGLNLTPTKPKILNLNETYSLTLEITCETGKKINWYAQNITNNTFNYTVIQNSVFTALEIGCFKVYATMGFDAVSNTVQVDVGGKCGTTVPNPTPSTPLFISNVMCSDFSRWRDAQDYYLAWRNTQADARRLDGDNDGIACESLPGHP